MHLLVAGPIAVGKTTFSQEVATRTGATHVSVRQLLHQALGASDLNRSELQRRGADLDRRTAGRWLLHLMIETAETTPALVVDSLRTRRQTVPLLEDLTSCMLIYLDAHDTTRRQRYSRAAATDPVKASLPYLEAINHPTERHVDELKPLAHLVLETDGLGPGEAAEHAIASLGLLKGR